MKLLPNLKISLLFSFVQISIVFLPTEQLKVAIKYHLNDLCIRAKDSHRVIIEECYWKANLTNRNSKEKEQTFDVHPADIDEQQRVQTQDGRLPTTPTSFLIRLSSQSSSSSSIRTLVASSCLASISSKLTVEKCQLRKSRFRIFGNSLSQLHSNCTSTLPLVSSDHTLYKIYSSDQSCIEFIGTNKTRSDPSIALTKCSSENSQNQQTHLWQFCTKNGNCSLSKTDLNWNTLNELEGESQAQKRNKDCRDNKSVTFATTTKPPTLVPVTETIITEPTDIAFGNGRNSSFNNIQNPSGTFAGITNSGSKEIPTTFYHIFWNVWTWAYLLL